MAQAILGGGNSLSDLLGYRNNKGETPEDMRKKDIAEAREILRHTTGGHDDLFTLDEEAFKRTRKQR